MYDTVSFILFRAIVTLQNLERYKRTVYTDRNKLFSLLWPSSVRSKISYYQRVYLLIGERVR